MARTHIVIRKSSISPPSSTVAIAGVVSTVGLGALERLASARRLPAGIASTAAVGSATVFIPGAATDVTTFSLTSNTTGTLPFTLGHAFKQGDVPSGNFIVSDLSTFQAEIRNRWPDGSVKFAVLSGRRSLTSGVPATVIVRRTATNPGGSAIPLSALQALNPSVSFAFSGFGTVTLSALLASPVRSFLGPQMSEFHYRSAVGADAHLAVWFFVRLYADNSIEIETCVENGYMKVASPVDKSYTATLTINGTTRFNSAITHYSRSRWFTINWYDGTSGMTDWNRVTPAHNVTYLRSTKMVPNYSNSAVPTATYLNTLHQAITPYQVGALNQGGADMGGGGKPDFIALMPRWVAAYCITGDARAYRAVVAHAYAGNYFHRTCYRDEATQRPLALTTRPNLDHVGWNIDPVATGGSASPFYYGDAQTQGHQPEMGYAGYLVTGRWTHLETCAFWAACSHITENPTSRGLTVNNGGSATYPLSQDRGQAWHIRNCMMAAAIYPDTCPTAADQLVRDNWITALAATFTKMTTTNVTQNQLGYFPISYGSGGYGGLPDSFHPTWQGHFFAQTLGLVWDLDIMTGSARTALQQCRDQAYKLPVGLLGTDPGGYCYRYATQYACALGVITNGQVNGPIDYDDTWAQVYTRMKASTHQYGLNHPPDPLACTANATIVSGGNFVDAGSYGRDLHPSISYAVEHGATGASTAYARMTSVPDWNTFVANMVDCSHWAVVPREDPAAMPTWYPSAAGQVAIVPSSSTTCGSAVRANGGDAYNAQSGGPPAMGTDPDDIVKAWGGGTLLYIGGQPYLIAMGGGHGDSAYNGIVKFGPLFGSGANAPTWSAHKAPSATSSVTQTGIYADGRRASNHEYNNLVGVGPTIYAMTQGGLYPASGTGNDSRAFAITATTQTEIASNPTGASFNAAAHYNGNIYLVTRNSGTFLNRLRIYNIASNTWSIEPNADPTIFGFDYLSCAVDTNRGALLAVCPSYGVYWNLNTLARSTGKTVPSGYAQTISFDANRDVFVAYRQGTNDIMECSASSLAAGGAPSWTARTFTGPAVASGTPNGVFGLFQYVPELRGYIYLATLESAVYFYRGT